MTAIQFPDDSDDFAVPFGIGENDWRMCAKLGRADVTRSSSRSGDGRMHICGLSDGSIDVMFSLRTEQDHPVMKRFVAGTRLETTCSHGSIYSERLHRR